MVGSDDFIIPPDSERARTRNAARHRTQMIFERSKAFDFLMRADKETPYLDGRKFYRLLQNVLCMPADFCKQFAKIDWELQSNHKMEVAAGMDRAGRDIVAQARTHGSVVPDTINVPVTVFKFPVPGEVQTIKVRLDWDVMNQQIGLTPEPDATDRAGVLAVDFVYEKIVAGVKNGVPVYRGTGT